MARDRGAGCRPVGAAWRVFGLLIFAPDLAMLGYLVGPRIGAVTYNAARATLGPLVLLALAALSGWPIAVSVALIWLAHVGIDRALGCGLKYHDRFGHTHLGSVGRR